MKGEGRMASRINRRTFLKTTTAATAGAYAARAIPAWATSDKSLVAVTTPLNTFPYADVQLLDGPMKRQFEENHARFLNLDDDRMLKVYRQVAGLPAPGEDMGGWYDLTGFSLEGNDFHGFIAGHSFGQYVSGLARAYAVTGSEATRTKINRLVKGYGETLDPKAKFFVDYRLPAYTYDKLSCGLIDAHEFAHDPMAMNIHEKITRAIVAYLPEKALLISVRYRKAIMCFPSNMPTVMSMRSVPPCRRTSRWEAKSICELPRTASKCW